MLRKWLLSPSMVTGSRCCQVMLIEGQILDNSIHHCFHNSLHPPSWMLSLVKRGDVVQLPFLAKAASHKLYCNYCSDGDFCHPDHLGQGGLWPVRLKFLWKVKSLQHITRSFTSSSSFSSSSSSSSSPPWSSSSSLCSASSRTNQGILPAGVMTGAGQTLTCCCSLFPGLRCFTTFCQAAYDKYVAQTEETLWLTHLWLRKRFSRLGIIWGLPAATLQPHVRS